MTEGVEVEVEAVLEAEEAMGEDAEVEIEAVAVAVAVEVVVHLPISSSRHPLLSLQYPPVTVIADAFSVDRQKVPPLPQLR